MQSSNEDECIEVYISGKVQGVFFRQFTQDTARLIGVKGYVQNLPDGRVKTVAKGDHDSIQAFLSKLREGPSMASVTNIEYNHIDDGCDEYIDFKIKY